MGENSIFLTKTSKYNLILVLFLKEMSYSTVLIIIKLSIYIFLFKDSYSKSLPLKLTEILFGFIFLKKEK